MDFPSIALLTDFGTRDGFVGVMKGVMLSRLAQPVPLVDISHGIEPQSIRHGVWVLESAFPYFPPKTIFICVVDPHVGNPDQASLLCYWQERQQVFIAPDNGLLTPVLEAAGKQLAIYDIRQSGVYRTGMLCPQGRSQTFHGRDVYAPTAALAANTMLQGEMSAFLQQFMPLSGEPIRLETQLPCHSEGGEAERISGEVVVSDVYGNLITNIPAKWASVGQVWQLSQPGSKDYYLTMMASYDQGAPDEPMLIPSSGGTLEISIYKGSAWQQLGIVPGAAVSLVRLSN